MGVVDDLVKMLFSRAIRSLFCAFRIEVGVTRIFWTLSFGGLGQGTGP
jgi:hypothetical protein